MNGFEESLHRMALLDRADRILNEVRVYSHQVPVREAIAQHRAMLSEARRHIESAQARCRAA
ncbi:hypothetical protein [Azospirillum sp. TSO22-1]|uniref:hypothetical protein n=1 Tax=Azospirillum sp. TSO22-1 TaxID=716789 RepID=UPI000D60DE19|nr:hypothetical protein [Azospirillum sp. TSO22-1]PWC54335.1 hypothetical protein TSO221_08850 [Azospirillum sp. TSO22-1]